MSLQTWHQAFISYDGSVAKLYLDGDLGCQVPFSIVDGNDKQISTGDFSNALTFKGVMKNLRIYDVVFEP